ncbi:ataxin-1-like [Dendropsophus ebraccatus]|uniref:ataxin-1-like n=1 Tax=Dendropsophus ebraccatus TaxID=150705 RepID=UPI0038321B04
MKPAHERSQECLPPKKRDLAQSTINIEEQPPKVDNSSTNESSANESSTWPRGVLVASGQGHGVRYEVAGEGTEAVTVDQYGNLYKLAVPPTFSPPGLHPVVNMGSLPPSFNVASPLIQHPGITYPPIHYAPISHTSVQFLGSPYAVPYAVPPGFLQRAVISPPATLATSHVPHYVPYNSILPEGVTPPPQPPSPQTFSKVTTAQSPSVLMGVVPVDVTKGRVPVFYQHSSQMPAGYPVHEMLLACPPNTERNLTSPSNKETLMASINGSQRGSECASNRRVSQAVEQYIHNSDEEMTRGQSDNLLDCDAYSGHAAQRTEVALMTHRSTPDTDLEVQRVVGGMVSQEYCSSSVPRKQRMSPLNLSNDIKQDSKRSNSNITSPPRGDLRGAYGVQHTLKYTEKNALISNGESTQGTVCSAERLSSTAPQHASKNQETRSPEVHSRGRDSPPSGPPQPPHSTTLPSHFMKGAIIQLATGELKRVEDLQTQDFVRSAEVSGGLKIDSSTVVDIQESQWPGFVTLHFVVGEQQSKVCLDVPPEHPFFVYGQGWSSCSPSQTAQLFALPCHRLQVGDVCISISLQSISKNGASSAGNTSTHQVLPHPIEKAVLQSRECPLVSGRDSDKQNQHEKDGLAQISLAQTPLPSALSSWSSPGVQRYSGQSTEARPSPSRHSFIPQEVKLSIEGRSNAGK